MKYRYSCARTSLMGYTSVAQNGGEPFLASDALDAIIIDVWETLATDLFIEIGGVRMHVAAWDDPEHWSEEWKALAGEEDVDEFIAAALARAVEP